MKEFIEELEAFKRMFMEVLNHKGVLITEQGNIYALLVKGTMDILNAKESVGKECLNCKPRPGGLVKVNDGGYCIECGKFIAKMGSMITTPVPQEAQEGGLWRELDDYTAGICPTELADDIRNTLEDMLYRHPQSSPVKEEPKDCGFTLSTCPYEREAGITMRKEERLPQRQDSVHDQLQTVKDLARKNGCYDAEDWITLMQGKTFSAPVKEESLEELAKRKGMSVHGVEVLLRNHFGTVIKTGNKANTIQYLSTLPDTKDEKEKK